MIDSIEFKLDSDGFVSQECPACERQFKVKFGEGAEGPLQYCPYCDHVGEGCWWTKGQAAYIESKVSSSVHNDIQDMFADALKGSKSISFKPGPRRSETTVQPPDEPENDWPIVVFRSGESIKHDGTQSELRCPVTGQAEVF